MALDVGPELSIEQLIGALNKKLFIEFTSVQSTLPPASPALVAALTAEVWSSELKTHPRVLTKCFQVDALEKRAKDVLHEVITLRNFLRPVNRLHPEVIALCATFVSDTDSPKPIIPLTHVCRYWRRAIASSPRNWTSIGSGWKRLAPLCLERSAAVPLSVKISASDIQGDEGFLQALVPHTSRIFDLSLTGYPSIESVANDLPGFFASPIGPLTSLELKQTDQPAEPFPSNDIPPHPLFQSVSKLKSLHFIQIPLYPAVLSITSLVELKLTGYTAPFDFGRFIEFLYSNPNLEFVTLDLQFAKGSVRITPKRKASLTQLQRLVLTCSSATDARALLSWVSIRRGSCITIQGSQSNSCTNLSLFLPQPPTSIRKLFAPIATVKYCSPRWFHIFGGGGQLSFQTSKVTSSVYGELDLFVTTAVREFHVDVHTLDPGGYYLSWPLKQLPALEALVFSETRLLSGSLSGLAEEPILCPSLRTIAFFDCMVTKDVVKELEEVLAKRRESTAARLYRVVIVNNTRSLPDLQLIHRLRESVLRVDVGVGSELPDLL